MTGTATILRRGDLGPEVVDLQYLLHFRADIKPGLADGDLGPKMEAAVKAAQKKYGLDPDGEVHALWGKLTEAREWPTKFTGKFTRQGDTGDGVTTLQQGLKSKGFYSGAVDGDFGPLPPI